MLETFTRQDEQIKRIKDKNPKLVQREQLYKHNIFCFQNKIYKGYDETQIYYDNDFNNSILQKNYLKPSTPWYI